MAIAVFALFLGFLAIRMTAPSDLATGDQPLQVSYILDIVYHNGWVVQHDAAGNVSTKPPLYNWIAAIPILITGRIGEVWFKLPTVLAAMITVGLLFDLGRRIGGNRTAFLACAFFMATPLGTKHLYFARTDMLMTLFIVALFWCAIRSDDFRNENSSLVNGTWIFASLAMLTKGPIAVLIPLLALLAWWTLRGDLRTKWSPMKPLLGMWIVLLPFAVWLAATVWFDGTSVLRELFVRETLDRLTAGASKAHETRHVLYYIPQLLDRMAPWSLLTFATLPLLALASRSKKEPIYIAATWFASGLFLLSIIPSKRGDRLFPLLPAAALLSAWGIDRLLSAESTRAVLGRLALIRSALQVWMVVLLLATLLCLTGVPADLVQQLPLQPIFTPALILIVILCVTGLSASIARRSDLTVVNLMIVTIVAIILYQYEIQPGLTRTLGWPFPFGSPF